LSNDTNSTGNNGDGPGILQFIDAETAEHDEEEPDYDINDEDDEGVHGEFQTPAIQQQGKEIYGDGDAFCYPK
jgi:hypothetical protein